jgi:hypothetical protein
MARTVQCIKLGTEAEGLDFPPYPGELGKRIWESVSKPAWAEWMKQQTPNGKTFLWRRCGCGARLCATLCLMLRDSL